MAKEDRRRSLVVAVTVLVVLLLAIGAVATIRSLNQSEDSSQKTTAVEEDAEVTANDTPAQTEPQVAPETTIDPSTTDQLTIAPMGIAVSYVRGVGGFEYQILRTANGTRFVEFSTGSLVGTKCTNDTGVFVSILESPDATESATLAETVTLDDTTYGLSLADATCTSDAEALKTYQQSFVDAFSLLKKAN